jgi:hypothetical protein
MASDADAAKPELTAADLEAALAAIEADKSLEEAVRVSLSSKYQDAIAVLKQTDEYRQRSAALCLNSCASNTAT